MTRLPCIRSAILSLVSSVCWGAALEAQDDATWIKPEDVVTFPSSSATPKTYGPRLELAHEAAIEFWIKIPSSINDDRDNPQTNSLEQPVCLMSAGRITKNKNDDGSTTAPLWGVYVSDRGFYLSTDGKVDPQNVFDNQANLRVLSKYKTRFDQWQQVFINIGYNPAPKPQIDQPGAVRVGPPGAVRGQPAPKVNPSVIETLAREADEEIREYAVTVKDMLFPPPSAEGSLEGGGVILTVGSGPGGAAFQGQLGVVRIWDRQLAAAEMRQLKNLRSFDPPSLNDCSAQPFLLCNISNTSLKADKPELVVPPVYVMPFDDKLSGAGAAAFSRRPLGMAPRSIYVRLAQNQTNLQSLQVEYDQPGTWSWGLLPAGGWRGPWFKQMVWEGPGAKFNIDAGDVFLSDFAVARLSPGVPIVLPSLEPTAAALTYSRAMSLKRAQEYDASTRFGVAKDAVRSQATKNSLTPLMKFLNDAKQKPGFDVGGLVDFVITNRFLTTGLPEGVHDVDDFGAPITIYKKSSLYGSQVSMECAETIINDSRIFAAKQTDDRTKPYSFTQSETAESPWVFGRFFPAWKGDLVTESDSVDQLAGDSQPQEEIVGIAGTHDGDVVTSLRFITSQGVSQIYKGQASTGGRQTFVQMLPTAYPSDYPDKDLRGKPAVAVFEGFVTRADDRGLHAITMACSFQSSFSFNQGDAEKSVKDITELTAHRYIAKAAGGPDDYLWKIPRLQDDNLPISVQESVDGPVFHGTFTTSPVYTFKYDDPSGVLTLFMDTFSGITVASVGQWKFTPENVTKPGSPNWISAAGHKLTPYTDKSGQLAVTVNFVYPGTPITFDVFRQTRPSTIPAPATADGGKPKDGWNVLFQRDQQPPQLASNYYGYNIAMMRPQNYQDPGKTNRNVFHTIKDGDMAFYSPNNWTKYVPNGLIYIPINTSSRLEKSLMYMTAQDDQSSWGIDLGINGGVKPIASFSLDASYNSELKSKTDNKTNTIRSRAVNQMYALVIDRSVMDLPDGEAGFKAEIDRIKASVLADVPYNWESYFSQFGTHYPYAVVYGGMYTSLDGMTEDGYENFKKQGFSVSASAKASFAKIYSVGVKAGGNQEWADAFSGNTTHQNASAESYGGSLDSGGNWSCSHGQEVPIFLDLRPQYELLSPIYFDDPLIWTVVRDEMMNQTETYLNNCAQKAVWATAVTPAWTPAMVDAKDDAVAAAAAAKIAAEAATEVKLNSKVILKNKQTGRYITGIGGEYIWSSYYATLGTDLKVATNFLLLDSVADKKDASNVTYLRQGLLLNSEATYHPGEPDLMSFPHSIGYGHDTTAANAQWTFIKATDPKSTDVVRFNDEIRILNNGSQEYLYDYNGDYLWSDSLDVDPNKVWIVIKPPASP